MRPSIPTEKLRRQAKQLARSRGIALHRALDQLAREQGFRSWSHLMAERPGPAARLLATLRPGDMLLLGGRPGQGKTRVGLELAARAAIAGRNSVYFSLYDTHRGVVERLATLGLNIASMGDRFAVDTSDEIAADRIIARLERQGPDGFAVIDYLQILDQRRVHPPLAEQVKTLSSYARRSGAIVVALSQIDRTFDISAERVPSLQHVRAPNPFDVSLFNKTCLLHEGKVALTP